MFGLRENITEIFAKMNLARMRSVYQQDVKLLAVSKTYAVDVIQSAYSYGLIEFGENRVQEILAKKIALPSDIEWHLIGHLQTNKVKAVLPHVKLIHSLDSKSLADEIDKRAEEITKTASVLVEVNIAKEDSKHGIYAEELPDFLDYLTEKKHLRVEGLMTIAPYVRNPEEVRWVFKNLNYLFGNIKEMNYPNVSMNCLSMGMTNDYEIAIEEGANLVRIGSAIFGARKNGGEVNESSR